jgi:hypothetical protein
MTPKIPLSRLVGYTERDLGLLPHLEKVQRAVIEMVGSDPQYDALKQKLGQESVVVSGQSSSPKRQRRANAAK